MFVPFVLALTAITATNASASADSCVILTEEKGSYLTLQGAVDAQSWSSGSYDMQIESRQGGNISISRQSGAFNATNPNEDGLIVFSTTTLYLSPTVQLSALLRVDSGERKTTCTFSITN